MLNNKFYIYILYFILFLLNEARPYNFLGEVLIISTFTSTVFVLIYLFFTNSNFVITPTYKFRYLTIIYGLFVVSGQQSDQNIFSNKQQEEICIPCEEKAKAEALVKQQKEICIPCQENEAEEVSIFDIDLDTLYEIYTIDFIDPIFMKQYFLDPECDFKFLLPLIVVLSSITYYLFKFTVIESKILKKEDDDLLRISSRKILMHPIDLANINSRIIINNAQSDMDIVPSAETLKKNFNFSIHNVEKTILDDFVSQILVHDKGQYLVNSNYLYLVNLQQNLRVNIVYLQNLEVLFKLSTLQFSGILDKKYKLLSVLTYESFKYSKFIVLIFILAIMACWNPWILSEQIELTDKENILFFLQEIRYRIYYYYSNLYMYAIIWDIPPEDLVATPNLEELENFINDKYEEVNTHSLFNFYQFFGRDPMSFFFQQFQLTYAALIFFFCVLILIYIIFEIIRFHSLYENVITFEVSFLLLYGLVFLLITLISTHFIIIIILLELSSYVLYIVIPIKTEFILDKFSKNIKLQINPLSIESGLKYFFYSSLNTFFLFITLILLLFLNVELNYFNISYYLNNFFINDVLLLTIICLFFIFFLFKFSLFPFHWWVVDIFQTTTLPVLIILALPIKLLLIFLLIKLTNILFWNLNNFIVIVLVFVTIFSMFLGSFGMLYQHNLKRFLAYSTINHMSYIMVGFALNSNFSFFSIIIYIFTYINMMLIFFVILLYMRNIKTKKTIVYISELKYLYQVNYLFPWILGINLFSFIGLPPLSGFWGKFYIIQSIFYEIIGNFNFSEMSFFNYKILHWIFLLVVIILTSCVSAAAYLVLLKNIFFENTLKNTPNYYAEATNFYPVFFWLLLLSIFLIGSGLLLLSKDYWIYMLIQYFLFNFCSWNFFGWVIYTEGEDMLWYAIYDEVLLYQAIKLFGILDEVKDFQEITKSCAPCVMPFVSKMPLWIFEMLPDIIAPFSPFTDIPPLILELLPLEYVAEEMSLSNQNNIGINDSILENSNSNVNICKLI